MHLSMFNYPVLLSALSSLTLWLAARLGVAWSHVRKLQEEEREQFDVVRAATLTLLGLIIGFSFSMAMTRYDLRKNYEETEANAIGTEFVRAELLPAADQAAVQALLRQYLHLRVRFYMAANQSDLSEVNLETARIQAAMWAAVRGPSKELPSPVTALTLSGMNDVLNAQGYTQAAWWNRIPTAAWVFMVLIGMCSNLLIGYGTRLRTRLLVVLPVIVSIAFLLIADIDSPRGGLIRVSSQNLASLAQLWSGAISRALGALKFFTPSPFLPASGGLRMAIRNKRIVVEAAACLLIVALANAFTGIYRAQAQARHVVSARIEGKPGRDTYLGEAHVDIRGQAAQPVIRPIPRSKSQRASVEWARIAIEGRGKLKDCCHCGLLLLCWALRGR